jgi:Tfp pilus assembly protein PilW
LASAQRRRASEPRGSSAVGISLISFVVGLVIALVIVAGIFVLFAYPE